MKKILKSTFDQTRRKSLVFYIKVFYHWQLKNKLDKNSKRISRSYKRDIERYWEPYNIKVSTNWHNWYSSINGIKDVRYIPEDIFYSYIEPFYNKLDFKEAYSDKALYSLWFSGVKKPVTIAKNMSGTNYDDKFQPMTIDEILKQCEGLNSVVIKPTVESGGGRNIVFINSKDPLEMRSKVSEAVRTYKENFVIQEILEQHDILKKLNPTSVNTVRMTTFLYENKVYVLSSHIRIGNINEEHDHYGYVCGIKEDGSLQNFARKTKEGTIISEHPLGYRFENFSIPSYEAMKSIAQKTHVKFGHFRIISWDFAVDKVGDPILIEFNLRWQGLNNHQLSTGPLFGDLTEVVLEEVFGRK